MTSSQMRAQAREDLGNKIFGENWLMALALFVVYSIILSVASSTGIGALIVSGPLSVGFSAALLSMSRNKTKADIGLMFTEGFSVDFGRTLLIGLMQAIFLTLWFMLFCIPGIIKCYSYAMVPYIAADNPDMGWKECIDESKRIMNGNKWRLFCLDFSFIGWILLTMVTCGISSLWVSPYMNQARTVFYRDLINDYNVANVNATAETESAIDSDWANI